MSKLKRSVIRLAHNKPELREDLLPLLKEAYGPERLRRLRKLDPDDPSAREHLYKSRTRRGLRPNKKLERASDVVEYLKIRYPGERVVEDADETGVWVMIKALDLTVWPTGYFEYGEEEVAWEIDGYQVMTVKEFDAALDKIESEWQ